MKWNLRLVAAQREIWKASDLHGQLSEAGLEISSGKLSGLWSGQPSSLKLSDLDVICSVLGCSVDELLIPEQPEPKTSDPTRKAAGGQANPTVVPRHRSGRSLPPT